VNTYRTRPDTGRSGSTGSAAFLSGVAGAVSAVGSVIGAVLAAYLQVQETFRVGWPGYLLCAALYLVGAALLRHASLHEPSFRRFFADRLTRLISLTSFVLIGGAIAVGAWADAQEQDAATCGSGGGRTLAALEIPPLGLQAVQPSAGGQCLAEFDRVHFAAGRYVVSITSIDDGTRVIGRLTLHGLEKPLGTCAFDNLVNGDSVTLSNGTHRSRFHAVVHVERTSPQTVHVSLRLEHRSPRGETPGRRVCLRSSA
jgi:hypothetical protein